MTAPRWPSAPRRLGEDSAGAVFAGLHESIIGVRGQQAVLDAVRLVWASLWSDAALLYRKELGLDPAHSRMAVLVQEMVDRDRSGVAFGRDPRDAGRTGRSSRPCPGPAASWWTARWTPTAGRSTATRETVINWLPGAREDGTGRRTAAGSPATSTRPRRPAVAWRRCSAGRPTWSGPAGAVAHPAPGPPDHHRRPRTDDERDWYLTLRPGDARLRDLRQRVAEQSSSRELAAKARVSPPRTWPRCDDRQLADAIDGGAGPLARWKKIYWDEFIPFAHGVRRLATYYNDAVRPEDPYEFVGLLRDQPLLAARRNRGHRRLARQLAADERPAPGSARRCWPRMPGRELDGVPPASWPAGQPRRGEFVGGFEDLDERYLDIAYAGAAARPARAVLRNIVELARRPTAASRQPTARHEPCRAGAAPARGGRTGAPRRGDRRSSRPAGSAGGCATTTTSCGAAGEPAPARAGRGCGAARAARAG